MARASISCGPMGTRAISILPTCARTVLALPATTNASRKNRLLNLRPRLLRHPRCRCSNRSRARSRRRLSASTPFRFHFQMATQQASIPTSTFALSVPARSAPLNKDDRSQCPLEKILDFFVRRFRIAACLPRLGKCANLRLPDPPMSH